MMRRRGVVVLTHEDLARMMHLGPHEHVTGLGTDSMLDAIFIKIEGDEESALPVVMERSSAPIVERPFAMVELRRRLLMMLREDSGRDPAEFAADLRKVLAEELVGVDGGAAADEIRDTAEHAVEPRGSDACT